MINENTAETLKCPYCGRLNSELYCQCREEDEAEDLDDTDGDVEDTIDRMAERFPDGEDPMLKHVINAQCTECEIGFGIYAGQVAWCPECHIHKDPPRPPAEILEDVEIGHKNKHLWLTGRLHIHFHGVERPFLFTHVFRLGEKAAAEKVVNLFSESETKPQRLRLYFNSDGLISDVEAITDE